MPPRSASTATPAPQWFVGRPSVLTLTFARTETIDRLIFRNAKGTVKDDPTRGSAPCEYFIETSVDGVTWRRVADSDDREPFSPAHAAARFRPRGHDAGERQGPQRGDAGDRPARRRHRGRAAADPDVDRHARRQA
jgi:hypothetical protein